MRRIDIAVVGSGIGGSLISGLNRNKNLILFEKDKNLGGCASTFKKNGYFFNAGATTFVGYEKNHPVKNILDEISDNFDLLNSKVAIRVIQKGLFVDRVENFDDFLENINKVYPNKNNEIFWRKIKEIDEKFWSLKKVYFSKYTLKSYFKTFLFICELFKTFRFDLLKSAESFINEVLGDISDEYKKFIDAQLFITIQSSSKGIPLLSLALGLSYPFHKVFYANNGMSNLISDLLKNVEVKNTEEVIKIKRKDELFYLKTNKDEYLAKNVILNSSIFDCSKLFDEKKVKDYYQKFEFNDQSAFVVYLKLNVKEEFLHHYQIILDENIPNCISNSFFVSFSDIKDDKLSFDGLSVTISTHTKAIFWKNLSKDEYKKQKQLTMNYIIEEFLKNFDIINKNNILKNFAASSKTFNTYINRFNCGGSTIKLKNILNTPSCKTPFHGLYNVGDTIFAGQGWPGVALGVKVLNEELNEKL